MNTRKKLKFERDQVETEEREKSLATREAALRSQEQEVAQLKKTVEHYPQELETALEKREQEVVQRLTQQFSHEQALLAKESEAQIHLLELTVKNLQDRLASQSQEMSSLKQQAEDANAKAQTLAMKAIERPTTIVAPTTSSQNTQPTYHDRSQGRDGNR